MSHRLGERDVAHSHLVVGIIYYIETRKDEMR